MKKLVSIILTIAMLLAIAASVSADGNTIVLDDSSLQIIQVLVDGEEVEFDVAPIIENDRVLVPMRAIFEKLGAEVTWWDNIKTVYAAKMFEEDIRKTVTIKIGENKMQLQESKIHGDAIEVLSENTIELDAPAQIINERTFVPLRAVSEAFDCTVDWNGDTKTVTITSKQPEPTFAPISADDTYTSRLMAQMPQNENFVISPFSLKMAMLMTANGAKDETQKEILDAFGVKDINKYNESAKETIARLNTNDNGEVNIANSVWFNKDQGGKNGDFSDSFKDTISDVYIGTAETVTNKDSVEKVNEWVEKQTKGKITNLLTEDNREYLTALVNAIYMKADWVNQFTKEATYQETFTDINGNKTETDFMHQTSHVGYYEDRDTKAVKLPYTNGLSMYVVLGDTDNILNDLYYKGTETKKVNLSLPKFKTEYSITFDEILKNMGINKAFTDNNPDFSPMVQNVPVPIKIETVLQKAIIEVDEKGTEAAAATAVMVGATSAMPVEEEIVEFKADEPFTYYIIGRHDEVLFAGRYVKCE